MEKSAELPRSRSQSIKGVLQTYGKYLLSHHPLCQRFESHTLNIGTRRFCIGCFIGYPMAAFSLFFFTQILLNNLSYSAVFYIGLILFAFQVLSVHHQLTEKKVIKITQKAAMGLGAGILLHLFLLRLQFSPIIEFFIAFGMIFMLLGPILFLHIRKSLKICTECPLLDENTKCPEFYNFAVLRSKKEKYN